MKKCAFILRLFLTFVLLSLSFESFAAAVRIPIRHYPLGDYPIPRTELVVAFADKETGSVEVRFSMNLGEVCITLTDSTGNVADETTIDTATVRLAVLEIDDPQESYTLTIESDKYYGEGTID